MTAQVIGFLSPTWETWSSQLPASVLAIMSTGKVSQQRRARCSLSLSLSLHCPNFQVNKHLSIVLCKQAKGTAEDFVNANVHLSKDGSYPCTRSRSLAGFSRGTWVERFFFNKSCEFRFCVISPMCKHLTINNTVPAKQNSSEDRSQQGPPRGRQWVCQF